MPHSDISDQLTRYSPGTILGRAARVNYQAVVIACLSLVCITAPVAVTAGAQTATSPAGAAVGTLLAPRENHVASVHAESGAERSIPVEGSGLITDLAASPDGARFAISRLARRPEGSLGRDIIVFPRDGGAPELMIPHDSPRVFLGGPAFSADGQTLLYDRQDSARPPSETRVEEISLSAPTARVLAMNARTPAPSPDGERLAFVRWGAAESLILASRTGGPERILVSPREFLAVAAPRFSPDGSWIAFAAVSDLSARWDLLLGGGGRYGHWLARPVRHGYPWEIWLIRPEGTELHRVTELGEDEPTVAWSPDGSALAVYGGLGLTLVDPWGGSPPRLVAGGGFGLFGWVP